MWTTRIRYSGAVSDSLFEWEGQKGSASFTGAMSVSVCESGSGLGNKDRLGGTLGFRPVASPTRHAAGAGV